jgi:hypothetical protein
MSEVDTALSPDFAPAYRFASSWQLRPGPEREDRPLTVGEVYDVLQDVAAYPEWWRSVVAVGRVADDVALVACRSRMPTTLHLVLSPVVRDRDGGVLEAALTGDLVGWSRFALTAAGEGQVCVDYAQQVDTTGRFLGWAGRVARPVLEWNHQQMMRALETDLAARLRALT